MRLPALARLLAALVVVAAPAAARAQFVVYTDLTSFLAAISNPGTDSFDDLPVGPVSTPLARSAGAFDYMVSANTTDFYAVGAGTDHWLSVNTSTDIITFSGFGPAVRGVGAYFFGTDVDGVFRPGTSLTVRATDASGTTTETLANATTSTFLGFVSAGAITSLTVEAVLPAADLAWPTVNDLVVGQAVPEPSTLVIVGTGLVGLALVVRRRRAA